MFLTRTFSSSLSNFLSFIERFLFSFLHSAHLFLPFPFLFSYLVASIFLACPLFILASSILSFLASVPLWVGRKAFSTLCVLPVYRCCNSLTASLKAFHATLAFSLALFYRSCHLHPSFRSPVSSPFLAVCLVVSSRPSLPGFLFAYHHFSLSSFFFCMPYLFSFHPRKERKAIVQQQCSEKVRKLQNCKNSQKSARCW